MYFIKKLVHYRFLLGHLCMLLTMTTLSNTNISANADLVTTTDLVAKPIIKMHSCSVMHTSRPVIVGSTDQSIAVTIFIDGVASGATFTDASGNFRFTTQPIADGKHTIQVAIQKNDILHFSNTIILLIDTRHRNELSKAIAAKYCLTCTR